MPKQSQKGADQSKAGQTTGTADTTAAAKTAAPTAAPPAPGQGERETQSERRGRVAADQDQAAPTHPLDRPVNSGDMGTTPVPDADTQAELARRGTPFPGVAPGVATTPGIAPGTVGGPPAPTPAPASADRSAAPTAAEKDAPVALSRQTDPSVANAQAVVGDDSAKMPAPAPRPGDAASLAEARRMAGAFPDTDGDGDLVVSLRPGALATTGFVFPFRGGAREAKAGQGTRFSQAEVFALVRAALGQGLDVRTAFLFSTVNGSEVQPPEGLTVADLDRMEAENAADRQATETEAADGADAPDADADQAGGSPTAAPGGGPAGNPTPNPGSGVPNA